MPLTPEKKQRLQSLYAGRHKAYLAEHHPDSFAALQKDKALERSLSQVGSQAAEAYELLKDQMLAKAEEIADPLEPARYLDRITLVAEELVNAEIVYAQG
jgi:hypothetical protein